MDIPVATINLPETNSSHLKMDGWNLEDKPLLLGLGLFSRTFAVSFQGGSAPIISI